MDVPRQGVSNAVIAMVVRQFTPSRIERQLLTQVFDLVSHDQRILKDVSSEWSEHHPSVPPPDHDEVTDESRALLQRLAGRSAA